MGLTDEQLPKEIATVANTVAEYFLVDRDDVFVAMGDHAEIDPKSYVICFEGGESYDGTPWPQNEEIRMRIAAIAVGGYWGEAINHYSIALHPSN